MALLCLILFGLLQASYLIAARNVINYSSVATARAASVGLNDFMLYKVSHYAAIPAAGPALTPTGFEHARPEGGRIGSVWDNAISRENNPRSALGEYEVGVKEAYHLAPVHGYHYILDYENWQRDDTGVHFDVEEDPKQDMLHVTVDQNVPLVFPFADAIFGFFARQRVFVERKGRAAQEAPAAEFSATSTIEDHAKLYLLPRAE